MNKRLLSGLLALVMVASLATPVFATTIDDNPTSASTNVTYVASTESTWSIVIPATMNIGQTASISVSGEFPSDKSLSVSADDIIRLTDTSNASDTSFAYVNFNGILIDGSNTSSVSGREEISVDEPFGVLFGTWTGNINFDIELVEAGTFTFDIDGIPDGENLTAKRGMTWAQWLESDHNPGGHSVTDTESYDTRMIGYDGWFLHNLSTGSLVGLNELISEDAEYICEAVA